MNKLKQNFAPYLFAAIIIGLFAFSFWSHIDQEKEIDTLTNETQNLGQTIESIRVNGNDDLLVGASTLFAQNASVQLNFEVLGTYASTSGNLSFNGEIMPDGATCGVNEILKRTGANNWDCAADASGSVASNSLNFDEFQDPLVLDGQISFTSASYPFAWGATSFLNVGTASFSKWLNIGGVAGVRIDGDGDGAITFLGLGNGSDENVTLNLDDTANTGVWSSTTGLNKFDFGAIGLELDASTNLTLGANTATHDGTTFVFNDDAVFSTGAGSSSFAGSLNITKGLVANNFSGAGLANCNATNNYLAWSLGGGQFICDTTDDAFVPDGITVNGGVIGSNNISASSTWTTLGTLTIGDNGDVVNFDTSTWDISSGVFSGVAGMTGTGDWDLGGAELEVSNGTSFTFDTVGEVFFDTTDFQFQVASASANTPRAIPTMQKFWSASIASTSNEFFNGGSLPLPTQRKGFRIKEIHCGIGGGTSVVINVANRNGNNNTETLTCTPTGVSDTDITTNNNYTAFTNASASLEFGAITGTLDAIDYLDFSIWGVIAPQ